MEETRCDIKELAQTMCLDAEWVILRGFQELHVQRAVALQAEIVTMIQDDTNGDLDNTLEKYRECDTSSGHLFLLTTAIGSCISYLVQLSSTRKVKMEKVRDLRKWAKNNRQLDGPYAKFLSEDESVEKDLIWPMMPTQIPDLISQYVTASWYKVLSKVRSISMRLPQSIEY